METFFRGARVLNKEIRNCQPQKQNHGIKSYNYSSLFKNMSQTFTCCIESNCVFGSSIYRLDCHQLQEATQQAVTAVFPWQIYMYCALSRRPHGFLTSLILSRKEQTKVIGLVCNYF